MKRNTLVLAVLSVAMLMPGVVRAWYIPGFGYIKALAAGTAEATGLKPEYNQIVVRDFWRAAAITTAVFTVKALKDKGSAIATWAKCYALTAWNGLGCSDAQKPGASSNGQSSAPAQQPAPETRRPAGPAALAAKR
jgi:hypothetical protein